MSNISRRTSEHDPDSNQSTTEMFKDMLSQKKNMLLSKLTSFESDVSIVVQKKNVFPKFDVDPLLNETNKLFC